MAPVPDSEHWSRVGRVRMACRLFRRRGRLISRGVRAVKSGRPGFRPASGPRCQPRSGRDAVRQHAAPRLIRRQAPVSESRACSRRLFSAWPDRWPMKAPRIGWPARARSPTASSTLCRTNSSRRAQACRIDHTRIVHDHRVVEGAAARQPGGAQRLDLAEHRERTAVGDLARNEPARSATCCRPGGRSRAPESDRGRERSATGRAGSLDAARRTPRRSSTRTRFSTSIMPREPCCSCRPAQSIRNTNGAADPSRTGTSGPSTSTTALSIMQPGQGRHDVLDGARRGPGIGRGWRSLGAEPRIRHSRSCRAGMVDAQIGAPEDDAGIDRRRAQQ